MNFWRPSRSPFKALREGGIFFFRRNAPINKIGGFGVFASTGEVTIGQAWKELGPSNGMDSLSDFMKRVKKYRKNKLTDFQTLITFNIIVDPVFLNEQDWVDVPRDWSQNIVTGKSYSSESDEGNRLLNLFNSHRKKSRSKSHDVGEYLGFKDNRQAGFYLGGAQKVRLGQGAFRMTILSAYNSRCAVTETSIPATLQAAHIKKFSENPDNNVNNGILLRADIHSLFDQGLLEITPEYRVKLSDRFKELYPNSQEYLSLNGKKVLLPVTCH